MVRDHAIGAAIADLTYALLPDSLLQEEKEGSTHNELKRLLGTNWIGSSSLDYVPSLHTEQKRADYKANRHGRRRACNSADGPKAEIFASSSNFRVGQVVR